MDEATAPLPRNGSSADSGRANGIAATLLRVEPDDGAGYIRVIGSGFWSPAEVDQHFDQLRERLGQMRRKTSRVRVLVDLRDCAAQAPETIARLSARVASTYQEGDRVALVLASGLAKLQMRRAIHSLQHKMFVSPKAAAQWLMAYD